MPWAAVGAIGGALISSSATGSAADTQAASSAAATAEQQREYDLARADQAPYRAAGYSSLDALQSGNNTPLDYSSIQMDPGYQFGLSQGQLALDRQFSAAGGRISGAALKAAAQYGNDYGTTKWGQAYDRANQARSDRLNRLAALAGIGQTATQQTTAAGQNAANNIGNIMTAQGNASAAGQLAQGNIWSGAGNQLAALYGRNATPTGGAVNLGTATGNDLYNFY